MNTTEVKRQLIELTKRLDYIELEAMTILAEALHIGESERIAVERAVKYLETHTGYERQAQALVNGLEYHMEKEKLTQECKDLPAQEFAAKLSELAKKYNV